VIDGVFAEGEDGQVQFAEAPALTAEDLAGVRAADAPVLLRWFAPLRQSAPDLSSRSKW
jgi:hypothetical protein